MINKNKISETVGIDKLTKLEDLRCNKNDLKLLNISGLEKLKILDAAGNLYLRKVIFGNNFLLWKLDLGENEINSLNFPHLPSLKMLSLRENDKINASFWSSSFYLPVLKIQAKN